MKEITARICTETAILLIVMCMFYVPFKINIDQRIDQLGKQYNLFVSSYTTFLEIPVTVTAYSADIAQTDSTPNITASNKKVAPGYVALSRDLEKDYGLKFGDMVHLDGFGTFEFQDRMHKRKTRQVDIFMEQKKDAVQFGIKRTILKIFQ